MGEVPFVPTFICTKMKNRSHLYQNYSTRFLIGQLVSQRIITLIFYSSNRRKLSSRIVTAAVAPTFCELANRGYSIRKLEPVIAAKRRRSRSATTGDHKAIVGLVVFGRFSIFGTNAIDLLF